MTASRFDKRRVLLAPFGQHTRYLLRGYILHTLVVLQGLLCVGLAVDLVPQIDGVLAGAAALNATDTAARLLWFALLRSADMLPRFIPLASFLGVLWTEVAHTVSRERILIWNTGRSPLRCLTPVALLAVMFGIGQYAFDAYLRPAAMAAQIAQNLGIHGREFSRGPSRNARWFAFGNDVVLARIALAPVAVMHDVTLYRLTPDGRLREVDKARTAVPGSMPGTWILEHGNYWTIPQESQTSRAAAPEATLPATAFEQREVLLAQDTLHLSVLGITSEYLPQSLLRTLIENPTPDRPSTAFLTRLQFNYANALMPGAMALLAATLSLILFAYRASLSAQLTALPAGYVGYLAMKTFFIMGDRDYLDPVLAAWLAPAGLLIASGVLLAGIEWRRRKGGRRGRPVLRSVPSKSAGAA